MQQESSMVARERMTLQTSLKGMLFMESLRKENRARRPQGLEYSALNPCEYDALHEVLLGKEKEVPHKNLCTSLGSGRSPRQ